MLKAKLFAVSGIAMAMLYLGTGFASAASVPTYGGGFISPAPLSLHMAAIHPNAVQLVCGDAATASVSTTVGIVCQLQDTVGQVQNGIGILVTGAAVGLGVILGSVLAITWLPRLVRRFFPKGG